MCDRRKFSSSCHAAFESTTFNAEPAELAENSSSCHAAIEPRRSTQNSQSPQTILFFIVSRDLPVHDVERRARRARRARKEFSSSCHAASESTTLNADREETRRRPAQGNRS